MLALPIIGRIFCQVSDATTALPSRPTSTSEARTESTYSAESRRSIERRTASGVGFCTSCIVWSSAFWTVKYSMYDGPTRKAISAITITTAVVKRKPIIDRPRSLTAVMRPPSEVSGGRCSVDCRADTLELERRDVVPVEPDEERLAADVRVGDEAPIAAVVAVVAVVAHHEVVACGNPALEAVLIVIAVVAPRERPHVAGVHRQRLGVDGDRMALRRVAVGALDQPLQRLEAQPFEVAVAVVGLLRPRHAVDGELLVAILDDVAADADHALDEVLRRVERVLEHDDVAALRIGDRDHLAVDDRQPDPVGELVHQDEIADGERRPHRRRRDLERLDDERAQQEHGEQHREERFRVLDPDRLARAR